MRSILNRLGKQGNKYRQLHKMKMKQLRRVLERSAKQRADNQSEETAQLEYMRDVMGL